MTGRHQGAGRCVAVAIALGWTAAVVIAVVIGAAARPPLARAAAAGLSWSAPELIDHQPTSDPSTEVACPSLTMCVGDSGGLIDILTDPARSNRNVRAFPLSDGTASSLSCPATSLCVAVDTEGDEGEFGGGQDLYVSTDPAGGPGAWKVEVFQNNITSVSCPSTSLCVGLDGNGNVLTSTDPTAGPAAWTTTTLTDPLSKLVCQTAAFCLGLDSAGNVVTSSDPTGGAAAWIPSGAPSLGGTTAGISCPSASLCIVGTRDGRVLTSTDPAGSAPWAGEFVDADGGLDAVECPRTDLCLAGDSTGHILASSDPAGGWSAALVDGLHTISEIACRGASECVAADGAHAALVSTDPAARSPAWTAVPARTFGPLNSVACPAVSLCVTADAAGYLTSSNPGGGAGSWPRVVRQNQFGDGDGMTLDLACASRTLCLAVVVDGVQADGAEGDLFSFDPVGGAHAFRPIPVGGANANALLEVSCAQGVCRTGNGAEFYDSPTPAKLKSWKRTVTSHARSAITCPGTSLCLALHGDPADGPGPAIDVARGRRGPWRTAYVDGDHGLTGLACPSRSLCFAVDDAGRLLSSAAPGTRAWRVLDMDASGFTGIACPATAMCVATDNNGRIVIGRPR